MAAHNMVIAIQGHLLHQKRPLYLQPVDEQGRYPWMGTGDAGDAEDNTSQRIEETSISCSSCSGNYHIQPVDESGAGDPMDMQKRVDQALEPGDSTSNSTLEKDQGSSNRTSKRKAPEEEEEEVPILQRTRRPVRNNS